ncbi:hypothetical protein cyc_07142 [Cyclospora cayetanensis]|uniref:Tubby C-terminal domain-containing protein n=1 Tax=Cyclospora cayetanensis TaxID=88456 RepID=A0A1D3CYE8_9EIME|nr:hypothetical protein cyc_07142 [Cyclospora cayetanensis]
MGPPPFPEPWPLDQMKDSKAPGWGAERSSGCAVAAGSPQQQGGQQQLSSDATINRYGTPAQQLWHQYQQPLRQWDTSDWGPSGGEQTWYGEEENLACSASPAHQAPPVCSTSTETPTASSDIPTVRLTVGQWLLLPVHRRPEPPPQQEEGQQEEQQPHQLQEAPREKQQVTGRSGQVVCSKLLRLLFSSLKGAVDAKVVSVAVLVVGSDTQGAIGLQTFTIEASEDISASLAAAFPLFNPPRDAAAPPLAVASAAWNAIPTAAASAFLTPCPPPFSYRPAAAPALELASHMTAATAEGQRLCIKVRLDGIREVLPAEALWNLAADSRLQSRRGPCLFCLQWRTDIKISLYSRQPYISNSSSSGGMEEPVPTVSFEMTSDKEAHAMLKGTFARLVAPDHSYQRPEQPPEVARESQGNLGPGGVYALEPLPPRWDPKLGSYSLPFYGRARLPSAKNFQMVLSTGTANPQGAFASNSLGGDLLQNTNRNSDTKNQDALDDHQKEIFFMLGKVEKDDFCLDFRWPVQALEAFAMAAAALAKKRVVS